MALQVRDCCPECGSGHYKKNGHIHNGKQNYRCNPCGRSFVAGSENVVISLAQRDLIKKLLLERIPLRGISRVVGVSLRWLLNFITLSASTVRSGNAFLDWPEKRYLFQNTCKTILVLSNTLFVTITLPKLKQRNGALPLAHYLRFFPKIASHARG